MYVMSIFSIVKIDSVYEAFFSYNVNGSIQYGRVTSTKNLQFALEDKDKLLQMNIVGVIDFNCILKEYVDYKQLRTIRAGNGGTIVTDDETCFYCSNIERIDGNFVYLNFSTVRTPDIEKIEVNRSKPIIGVHTSKSIFEIYKLKDNIELMFSAIM